MAKYIAMYKCQMCGEMQRLRQEANAQPEDIEALLGKTMYLQDTLGSRSDLVQVQERIPHKCKDGSLGVSIFAGFKKIQ